jgi:hypothetical protein
MDLFLCLAYGQHVLFFSFAIIVYFVEGEEEEKNKRKKYW